MPYDVVAITISYSYPESDEARHNARTLGSLLPFVGLLCREVEFGQYISNIYTHETGEAGVLASI